MMVNRRQTMAMGAAIGGAVLSGSRSVNADSGEALSWSDVAQAFPRATDRINLLHTGGGDCTTETLNTLARYQTIAAATGVENDEVLSALKESGSSAPLRAMMASSFGCEAHEIALTRNAMEGLAIGLLGVDLKPGDEVITTRSDYDSCLKILYQRQARDAISVKLIDIPMGADTDEAIVSAFEEAITPRTRLISMCHMHNKSGQIIPVRKIADLARQKGILTVVDGAQSIGQFDFRISDLGCDIFAASLHKWFYGPRGTGVLYIREDVIEQVWPIWASWSGKPDNSIEKFEEFGTVSKAVSASLPSVFQFHERMGAGRKEARLRQIRDAWLKPLSATGRLSLITDLEPSRSCAIIAFMIDGVEPDLLATDMWERHGIGIGSIKLQYMPEFKGNYIAANLSNTDQDIAYFLDKIDQDLRTRY